MENTLRQCSKCLLRKPIDEFYTYPPNNYPRKRCKKCYNAYTKGQHLEYKYGISKEKFELLFTAQNGVCAICKIPSKKELNVDHNHISGEVRELLCHHCNVAIGMLRERVDIAEKLIEYLKKHSTDTDLTSSPECDIL